MMLDLLAQYDGLFSDKEAFKNVILKSPRKVSYLIEEDKQRKIKLRRDIYELAFALCLNQKWLEEFTKPDEEGDEE